MADNHRRRGGYPPNTQILLWEKMKFPGREVVTSSPGADAIQPPILGSFVQNTPGHNIGIGCLTPCKIIVLGAKTIPQ